MPPSKLDVDLYEDNLLDSCWRVGASSRSRAAVFSSFAKSEIAAVDIVACCKRITNLIEENASKVQRSDSVATRSRHQFSHFKDFARLTCGVTDIYSRQIDILLGDTKHLLDQMKGTNFNLGLTTTKKTVVRISRKRKRIITKERVTRVTIAKHPRLEESELLNESRQHYYANMLSECLEWESEGTRQQVDLVESIEVTRNGNQSSSYHAITFTAEFQIHEDPSTIFPSDGFGECDVNLTIFEELYPSRDKTGAKRHSTISDSTDILPAKMPRLDENIVDLNISQADSAIITTNYPAANSIDPANVTYIVCEPSLPPSRRMSCADSAITTTIYTHTIEAEVTAELTVQNLKKSKNRRKKKLKIDKCIEYSREKLLNDRCQYLKRAVAIPAPSKRRKAPEELLSKLGNCSIFPNLMRNYSITFSKEELVDQTEVTLRSIFGVEFTEDLIKAIIVPIEERKEIVYQPELENPILTPPLPLALIEINNNNDKNLGISYEDNNFDAHSVMMHLLMIWRNNPDIQGIDANKFIKSFSDRIKASLAFNFLLYLVRDQFIKISKKPNSIEMDEIMLGTASDDLIESLVQGESF